MNYLFKNLEGLCVHAIKGYNKLEDYSSIEVIQTEVTTLKETLKDLYFEPHGDQNFETFTHSHQKSLIVLLDDLKGELQPTAVLEDGLINDFNNFSVHIIEQVEDLLIFLHNYFQKYIDKRELIPEIFKAASVNEVEQMLANLSQRMEYLENPALTNILLKPFHDFIHSGHKTTFHNLFYCRILNREILRSSVSPGCFAPDQIISLMIYMNSNSNPVHLYIIKFIGEYPNSNELENLYYWLKRIRQAHIKPGHTYKINNPNLSAMLEKWIEEEIRYFKKSAQIRLNYSESSKQLRSPKTKILFNLSVAELALYYKVMIELNFIIVDNQLDFFRTITEIYRTKNAENISIESLRTKFYHPESGTRKSFKSKLIELLNYMNLQN